MNNLLLTVTFLDPQYALHLPPPLNHVSTIIKQASMLHAQSSPTYCTISMRTAKTGNAPSPQDTAENSRMIHHHDICFTASSIGSFPVASTQ
ncbi:hypothetical protein BO82DRAFT_354227 [Aspergillus uvarum CBS 121591]|uniref:Uncharacterized protein n=1 Tax=Aspergillus uvarum CBS 121591 TaxID=1448315 RepID=A0A319CCR5_9EURO|nr:hypothetical protein BO82DRAFT_354227 [Aspergillus uvarum CBS 121591]PYH82049.1 hypothetical protein BO82DRAFT_354227 [Aspergillus uvarum CBS 121591]